MCLKLPGGQRAEGRAEDVMGAWQNWIFPRNCLKSKRKTFSSILRRSDVEFSTHTGPVLSFSLAFLTLSIFKGRFTNFISSGSAWVENLPLGPLKIRNIDFFIIFLTGPRLKKYFCTIGLFAWASQGSIFRFSTDLLHKKNSCARLPYLIWTIHDSLESLKVLRSRKNKIKLKMAPSGEKKSKLVENLHFPAGTCQYTTKC